MVQRPVLCLIFAIGVASEGRCAESDWVYRGQTGRLIYAPDAQGDRVPDFSDVGYHGGRTALPTVATAVTVQPVAGDDTASIQAAINQVSALPLGPEGFRGAVELAPGDFQIGTHLQINASGVVLRGSGRDAGGTRLQGTGTSQRSLIQVFGTGSQSLTGSIRSLVDKVVPVGSRSFRVDSTSGFSVGDTVRVERPSPANWISDLGMDQIPPRSDGGTVNQWEPGTFNLRYDRVITRIEGDRVFVDAPLTNSFEQQYGGGTIRRYTWGGRIENIGVENLRAESDFASPTDEDHAWNFVSIDRAQNVWVRDTASAHFARSAVLSNPRAKWVTVDNAINETPKSRITGGRRYSFDLSGQLELVTNSQANEGRHDFVNNSTRPAGPHVFHNSVANNALSDSGPHQRWATGTLFDNVTVDGDQINVRNRGNFGTGHGWAGANMVIWNSTADSYIVQNPPTSQNWLVGSTGQIIDDDRFGTQEPGYTDSHGNRVDVDSLYESQLADASDVTRFNWSGGTAVWSDPEAWRERLTPGAYRVEARDYLVGDIDDFANDGPGSIDDAPIDPAWEALIQGGSALPITGFDDSAGNKNVAFTIQHQLDPGERVVHGSLALAIKQSGGVVSSDFVRLFNGDTDNKRSFAELGWDSQVNTSETFVGVVDLGGSTDHLQTGAINVQLNDDTAVDWALYTATVASPTSGSDQAAVRVEEGVAIVDTPIDPIGSLTLGGAAGGTLRIGQAGEVALKQAFVQEATGSLRITLGEAVYGRLASEGNASLGGGIELVHAAGYTPAYGDTHELITAVGLLIGAFETATLPGLGDGLRWSLTQSDKSLIATVVLAGDYDRDGDVDAADYTIWRDATGSSINLAADGNGDGLVDEADRQVWIAAFGRSASEHLSSSVPEPGAVLLVGVSLLPTAISRPR